jgi:hypothetical protein
MGRVDRAERGTGGVAAPPPPSCCARHLPHQWEEEHGAIQAAETRRERSTALTHELQYVTMCLMSTPVIDADERAPDPAAARAERRLALLEEMAEIGMRMLRRLDDNRASDAESVESYARVSRAVRLTLALEEKTDRFLAGLSADAQHEDQAPAPVDYAMQAFETRKAAIRERKADALDLLVAVSESEGESLESFEALCDALVESLDEVESCVRGERPLGATIEGLCARLGLGPELSRKVAQGWNAGYLASRPRFNPWRPPPEARSAGLRSAAGGTPAVQALRQLE